MSSSCPLVTVGLPLYNEEKFLREAFDSILAQDYEQLEIIASDNGSVDSTLSICQEYAQRDKRVAIIRHRQNIGAVGNFNNLVYSANGKYFFWAAGHDTWATSFVSDCVAALEKYPDAVLAYPRTMNMMPDGTRTREKVRTFDICCMTPSQRFREVMWRVDCNYVYGIWRHVSLLQSNLFRAIPVLDRVFLSEMAIKGTFIPVDTFKYYRMNRGFGETEIERRRRVMKYLFPHRTFEDAELKGNRHHLPARRGFFRVVQDSHLPWCTRIRCYLSIWFCGVLKFHLFPGADFLSTCAKKILPTWLQTKILQRMQ